VVYAIKEHLVHNHAVPDCCQHLLLDISSGRSS
jgi:hypothetical protein